MNSNQATFTVMAALCSVAFCQSPPATILTIEMENVVRYNENFATLSATEPRPPWRRRLPPQRRSSRVLLSEML